jgi:hypothetical protein
MRRKGEEMFHVRTNLAMKTNALHIFSSLLHFSILFVVFVSTSSFQVTFPLNRKYSLETDRALVDVFASVVSRADHIKKKEMHFLNTTVRSTLRILTSSNPTGLFSPMTYGEGGFHRLFRWLYIQ